ncbi:zinc finger CCCH domain-containing protein 6 [Cajanus cajan]|uniref:zinc finger CCCH domain-containing protein 6 n=1 Tax=Cajanus cajan TaxID=3821 RepID=UPI00098DD27A|nr:zinc finger CCCH domain-containing protein 6 [Cajanus cajan]
MSASPSTTDKYDVLPPGFGGKHLHNQSKAEHISPIKWKCPSSFVLRDSWLVAAGEESTEKNDQKQRELNELEAFYPSIYAIPPNPFVSVDAEKESYDDSITPLIPIEEEESVEHVNNDIEESHSLQHYVPSTSSLLNLQSGENSVLALSYPGADFVAATAIVAAIMKSNEQESMIDADSLLNMVNDPIIIEKIIDQYRTASSDTTSTPSNDASIPKPDTSSTPLPSPTLAIEASESTSTTTTVSLLTSALHEPATPPPPPPPPVSLSRAQLSVPHAPNEIMPSLNIHSPQRGKKEKTPLASAATGKLNKVTVPSASSNMHAAVSSVHSQPSAEKDVKHGKSLVRKHDTDKPDVKDSGTRICRDSRLPSKKAIESRKVKSKDQIRCKFFKTSKGCRKGSDCLYQHDESVQREADNAKRSKVKKEVTWRM